VKATVVREEVEFSAEDGVMLRGWVLTPDSEGPHPTILMSPGFTGSISRLEKFANIFVDRGFGVLLYDQRTCGRSDGLPRQDIDPFAQDRDMQMALSFAQQHPALDRDRLGLWGASYSGANVLTVAAIDRRVKAVVSIVPFIAGHAQFVLGSGEAAIGFIDQMIEEDRAGIIRGEEPSRVELVRPSGDPADHFTLFTDDETYEYLVSGPEGPYEGWINSVTVRSMARALAYDVRQHMRRISPTPLMLIVAADDKTTPPSLALEAYESALEPKELVMISGGHYGVYKPEPVGSMDLVMSSAARWFQTHLGKGGH
jgi:uncharacterized protein